MFVCEHGAALSVVSAAYFNKLAKGGHFAAWEQPAFFVSDVRAGFKSLRT